MILNEIFWCWYVLIFFWLINLFTNKRTVRRQSLKDRLQYVVLLLPACLLLFGVGFSHPRYPFALIIIPHSAALDVICLGLVVLGLLLGIWARVILGGNWSGTVTLKENHELIERGPYAYVRHPIYTAILLMLLGTAVAIGTWGAVLGFPLLYLGFWIKFRQEEALMIEYFGEAYRAYKKTVKALIPFVF